MGDLKKHLDNQKQLADYIASMDDSTFAELKSSILGSHDAIIKYREGLKEFR